MRALRLLPVLGASLALGLAACGGGSSNNASNASNSNASGGGSGGGGAGGSVTIALDSEPTTLDPQVRDDGGERAVSRNIYETLMKRTPDGELEPGLAAEAPKLVNAKTWEVKLKPNIKFSDGEPMNADAVVASIKRIIDPKLKSEQSTFTGPISGAKKVDDLTVDIKTKTPDPTLPSRLYFLTIVPPQASQKPDFQDHPVGTGPYTLKEWVKGDHITLVANPNYWGDPKPKVQEAVYKFVPEAGTRLSGLLAGDYDLITNLLPENTKQAPKFEAVEGTEQPVMILNARPGEGITSDVRVRQALNYAVDKNAIAKSIFGGYAKVENCQMLTHASFGFNPALQAYPYDPAKAKQLLEQAGATGKTINIVGESGRWLNDREVIEAVSQFWRDAGLKVNVQIFDFDEYLNRLFDQDKRPDAIYLSSSNELLDADRVLGGYYAMNGTGASNHDEQLTKWVDDAREETDTAKRQQLYNQATKKACDQAYFSFLAGNQDLYGLSKRLNWTPRFDGLIYVNTMSVSG
jgi:peptide/nickel transport system substrate-binding protein